MRLEDRCGVFERRGTNVLNSLLVIDRLPKRPVRPVYLDWTIDEETVFLARACLFYTPSLCTKHLSSQHTIYKYEPSTPSS